jgi:hypothetical protein
MKQQAKSSEVHVSQAGLRLKNPDFTKPLPVDTSATTSKRYKRPVTNFLINGLLKKN